MADPITWGIIIIAALAAAAMYLLMPGGGAGAPKADKGPLDDSRTEPSVKGILCPTAMGRNRVGAVVGYIGRRTVQEETEQ